MTTKTILGLSFAAFVAISLTMMPVSASNGSFLDIVDVKVSKNGKNAVIKVADNIDKDAKFYGYAIIGTGGILGITSHLGDDSTQQDDDDDNELHAHKVFGVFGNVCGAGNFMVTGVTPFAGNVNHGASKAISITGITPDIGTLIPSTAFSYTIAPAPPNPDGGVLCLTPHV